MILTFNLKPLQGHGQVSVPTAQVINLKPQPTMTDRYMVLPGHPKKVLVKEQGN